MTKDLIKVVFENKNFVVCEKPALCLSVPARERNDLRPCLGLLLQNKMKSQIYPVHRLDYEVSGLIMYALNAKAHKISQNWFIRREIHKSYQAYTQLQNFSHWPEKVHTDRQIIDIHENRNFTWKTQIQRGKKRSFESDHGEWAETHAQIVQIKENRLLWHLNPVTGKPHQLRLELSRRGFPIIGDQLYGSQTLWGDGGVALMAVSLHLEKVDDRLGLPEKIELKRW